jgi:hypothetical protein
MDRTGPTGSTESTTKSFAQGGVGVHFSLHPRVALPLPLPLPLTLHPRLSLTPPRPPNASTPDSKSSTSLLKMHPTLQGDYPLPRAPSLSKLSLDGESTVPPFSITWVILSFSALNSKAFFRFVLNFLSYFSIFTI